MGKHQHKSLKSDFRLSKSEEVSFTLLSLLNRGMYFERTHLAAMNVVGAGVRGLGLCVCLLRKPDIK